MEHEELLKLIDQLDQSSLAYFNYETEEIKLTLAKEMPNNKVVEQIQTELPKDVELIETAGGNLPTTSTSLEVDEEIHVATPEGNIMTSPMVGVAYLQPSPDSEPFIQVGDTVNEGDTILIVEAMKLMNEIQAEQSGVITEILVENETVVEYGQPLVRIK